MNLLIKHLKDKKNELELEIKGDRCLINEVGSKSLSGQWALKRIDKNIRFISQIEISLLLLKKTK